MLHTRRTHVGDLQFLWELHEKTFRTYVEATWGWDEPWQRQNFRDTRDLSRYEIIVRKGQDIGCIRIDDQQDLLFLDYIALLPKYQNQGFGTELVREILTRAARRGVPVRLRILKVNPARALYERLGFQVVGGDEFRHYMEANPKTG